MPALLALALALTFGCHRSAAPEIVAEGRFGNIRIFPPPAANRAMVFVFSDRSGWTPALDEMAARAANEGCLVVGVSLPDYQAGLAASDDGCHYLLSEVEDLSQRLQRRFQSTRYRSPILAGIGAGGTLAYAALAQSPFATVNGAISIDPAPAVATKVPLCAGAPATKVTEGFRYGVAPEPLRGWWRVDGASSDSELRALAETSHAIISTSQGSATERLGKILDDALAAHADKSGERSLALPLVEIPSEQSTDSLAVIYSGDGGWRDLDKQIGEVLAKHGVAVVGVDSLRYFWQERSPEQVAADLTAIVETYAERWHTRKVILIGYSFGADVVPFAYNRLPPEMRAQVVQLSLLGLEPRASFEIRVAGWLGVIPGEGNPEVLPEMRKLGDVGVQCFYGEEEDESLCRSPELASREIIRTEGGHHFDGDYVSIARRIVNGAKRRMGGRTSSGRR